MTILRNPASSQAKEWWRGAVIYQIYPRSFRDSNGDGIGDLRGCIEGLEYIRSLGVDAIWLSPFFTSPMRDFGYDIANYNDVDPIFGTIDDFDELVTKAHASNIKVIIDQVYSHTSNQHPWFNESRQDRTNSKSDWYVWADPKDDGSPPTNWQSVFEGSAWTWDSRRQQYYLHNFLSSQPDLNGHNPQVQDALLKVARFWLNRGVDGFRLDALNFTMHDQELHDNPPSPKDQRDPTRPFGYQQHKFNQSHPDIVDFIERIRKVTDAYDACFTVGEVVGPKPLREMKAFIKGSARLNSAYNFDFLYAEQLTSDLVKQSIISWSGGQTEGWPSWAFSNHDAPRAISRWRNQNDSNAYARLTIMLLLSLRGNVFVYQGEELGLEQAHIPFEKLKDPEAIANWPATLGRDGARTPMPWRKKAPNNGFSDCKNALWLPIDSRHSSLSIDHQEKDAASTLNFVKRMIALRQNTPAIRHGSIAILNTPDPLVCFTRSEGDKIVLCVFNLGDQSVEWMPPNVEQFKLMMSTELNLQPPGSQGSQPPALIPAISGYLAAKY